MLKPLSLLILLSGVSFGAKAEEAVSRERVDRRFSVVVSGGAVTLPSHPLNLGAGLAVNYVLSPHWAAEAGSRVSVDSSTFVGRLTEYFAELRWAPSGSLLGGSSAFKLGARTVMTSETMLNPSWGATAGVRQFLLNENGSLEMMQGLGAGGFYQYPLTSFTLRLDLGVDLASDGKKVRSIQRVGFGFIVPL